MADAKATKKALHSLLQNQRPRLALDMRQLEYIDSSGLAVWSIVFNQPQEKRRCLPGRHAGHGSDIVRTDPSAKRIPIEEMQQDAVERLSS